MSAIINYVRSLPNNTFEGVLEHFEGEQGLGFTIHANDNLYMLVSPLDHSSFDDKPILLRSAVNQSVGTILEKDTNKLICFGFPKTTEVPIDQSTPPFSGPIAAHEYTTGTLLRAYFYNDQWWLSTNGSADAYKSYWISKKSIGELFDECLCRIYKRTTRFADSPLTSFLVPGNTYLFMLQHPEMHLDNASKPLIYHMGTFNNNKLTYDYNIRVDRIPQPRRVSFRNYDELLRSFSSGTIGYVFFPATAVDSQAPRYKILSSTFKSHMNLIGRTNNLYLRYLECKAENTEKALLAEYPSIARYSSWVEKSLRQISSDVAAAYIEKYVKKNYAVPINFYLRPIVGAIREERIYVTPASVYTHISQYHPKRINFILNGLAYINTGDVRLPPIEEQSEIPIPPVASSSYEYPLLPVFSASATALVPAMWDPFTEAEMDEVEHMIELSKIGDKPTYEYLETLSEDELEDFLRPRFMPYIISELFMNEDEGAAPYDHEYVFGLMLDHSCFELGAAYDDDASLIPLIHECAEISTAMDSFVQLRWSPIALALAK